LRIISTQQTTCQQNSKHAKTKRNGMKHLCSLCHSTSTALTQFARDMPCACSNVTASRITAGVRSEQCLQTSRGVLPSCSHNHTPQMMKTQRCDAEQNTCNEEANTCEMK
jgi:hypothetical protein